MRPVRRHRRHPRTAIKQEFSIADTVASWSWCLGGTDKLVVYPDNIVYPRFRTPHANFIYDNLYD